MDYKLYAIDYVAVAYVKERNGSLHFVAECSGKAYELAINHLRSIGMRGCLELKVTEYKPQLKLPEVINGEAFNLNPNVSIEGREINFGFGIEKK